MESNQPDCYKVDHYGMRCGSNFHQWIPCPGLDLKVKHDTGDWTWSCDCVLITLKKYIDIWHGRFDDGMRKYGMNWIVFGGHCVVIVADNIVADMTLVECQRLKHKHWPMILINCWWCFQTFLFWILVLPALSCFIFFDVDMEKRSISLFVLWWGRVMLFMSPLYPGNIQFHVYVKCIHWM